MVGFFVRGVWMRREREDAVKVAFVLRRLHYAACMVSGNRRPGAVAMMVAEDVARTALEMRLRGMSYPEIGRAIGYTTEGARKAVKRGLDEARTESAETAHEVREQEAARLDRILVTLERLLERAEASENVDNALAVQDRLLKVQERRARLLGLDLQRVEVTGANGGPIAIASIQRVIVDPTTTTIAATVDAKTLDASSESAVVRHADATQETLIDTNT